MQYKIADLKNVSNGSEWSITARVLTKSEIIPFVSGNGKRLTTILFDKTTEIGATAFDQAADRLFSQLEENEVYNIKNGEIKVVTKKFIKSNNAYEIRFNGSTIIERTGGTDIPIHPQLTTIKDVFSMEINTFIDTIGVIIQIVARSDTHKIITLADSTGRVTVTLWDTHATNCNANEGDIMSIIRGQIIDFKNVKKISVTGSSKIVINPYWEVTSDLKRWYKELEKKKLLNLSQVSIGSQELNMVEISQSNRNQTTNEPILQQNKIDDDLISKRLLELNDEEHKIKTERTDLNFKRQRLSIERENIIKSNLEN